MFDGNAWTFVQFRELQSFEKIRPELWFVIERISFRLKTPTPPLHCASIRFWTARAAHLSTRIIVPRSDITFLMT